MLPPSKEKGLWAADRPAHVTTEQLHGFTYPLHHDGVPKAAHVEEACARKVASDLERHAVTAKLADRRARQCLAAKLWAGCVYPGTREGNYIDASLWDWNKVMLASLRVVDKNCPAPVLDKHYDAIQDLVIEMSR